MGNKFNPEEITEMVRTAGIYAEGFSEGDFRNLQEMQKHLKDSGYLEAAEALRLLEEDGIPRNESLKEYQSRRKQSSDLQFAMVKEQFALQNLKAERQEIKQEMEQIRESIRQANSELKEVQAARSREEKELEDFRSKAAEEKERINQELALCRSEAEVSRQEIEMATALKKEMETRGFNLYVVLSLAEEFGRQDNGKGEMVKAIEKYHTLGNANLTLERQGQGLQSKIDRLETDYMVMANRLEEQRNTHVSLKRTIDNLHQDMKYETVKENFYARYNQLRPLLERLSSWDQIFFYRCGNPLPAIAGFFNPALKNAVCWTDKPVEICPDCGLHTLIPDEKVYQSLSLPPGVPVRIIPGEVKDA